MMFHLERWEGVAAGTIAPAMEREARIWRAELGWDVRESWQAIEPARISGRLPGFIARHQSGDLAGFTCFLVHHRTLQVALLAAETPAAASLLVEGILSSAEAQSAETCAVCVRDAAPGLRDLLSGHGFDAVTYRYLEMRPGLLNDRGDPVSSFARLLNDRGDPVSSPARFLDDRGDPISFRHWRADDLDPVIRLLQRAYPDGQEVRAFAPNGTAEEWADYVTGLVIGPGCGRMSRAASFVLSGPDAGEVEAAVLATELGPGTGHIAQVAVDPTARRRGVGTALLVRTIEAFAAAGCERVTLLVSEANQRAAAIYERLGFRDSAAFVVAVNRQPRRLTSVALMTGGASTRL
jgi:ribosomal protein S18 acetylase RimI-like enzyme